MRCRWLAFLALVFEETKLNENPLSWNWTRQTKFLDRSELALRGDAVSGFMPREAGASFTSGATGHEQNVSPPGKVGPREALLGGWGNNKKICLASSLWIKIKQSVWRPSLCSSILHGLPPLAATYPRLCTAISPSAVTDVWSLQEALEPQRLWLGISRALPSPAASFHNHFALCNCSLQLEVFSLKTLLTLLFWPIQLPRRTVICYQDLPVSDSRTQDTLNASRGQM